MKKITVNQMNDALAEVEHEYRYIRLSLGDLEIVLDTELSFDDMQTFVDRIASAVVNEGGYFPAVRDVVFFATALQMMSNVNVPTKNTGVTGETMKILDLKKLQEWLYALGEEWQRVIFYTGNYSNLFRLTELVDEKIEHLLRMQQSDTPMQEFFRKAMDAIDNLSAEHGIGMADLAGMMAPQIGREDDVFTGEILSGNQMANESVAEEEFEQIPIRYSEDGTMMI